MKSSTWRRYQRLRLLKLEDRALPSGMPHMLLDINLATRSSNPESIVSIASTVYFAASDGQNSGLWRSDGSAGGTWLVKQFGATANFPISDLTSVNGTLYFAANDGVNGKELWKSDGTTAGTVMVADIEPVAGGYGSFPTYLTNVNGTLFFSAYNSASGVELWKSDGTAAGTVLVKDIFPGGDPGDPNWSEPELLTDVNGTLFFTANNGTQGRELWKSDGTTAGTVIVKDVYPGGATYSSNPYYLTNVNGTLYFTAFENANGYELWKSDGTMTGTVMVKDILPGSSYGWPDSSFPSGLTNVNGILYFAADDGINGQELWKSDGTSVGTAMVRDIWPGPSGYGLGDSSPRSLAKMNGTLFFSADDGLQGRELWKSDGTTAGTILVKDIHPTGSGSNPDKLTNVNGTLYFTCDDGAHGTELWKSNGTAAGTVMVKDISPSDSSSPGGLTNVNGTLYFAANDGVFGNELWKSEGTVVGTAVVKDINVVGDNSSPTRFTDVNGTAFFVANNSQLWKSDGTATGTTLVKSLPRPTGPDSALPHMQYLTSFNGTLFFVAWDSDHGGELWKSDGTEAGTVMVKDINPGNTSAFVIPSNPFDTFRPNFANISGTLYFTADDGVHGVELWKSDGTVAGTVMVNDINPGVAGSFPAGLTNFYGTLFFAANNGTNGAEPWKSDGTLAGTVIVKDINVGSGSSTSSFFSATTFTVMSGAVYFSAFDITYGRELWKSDGTEAGTQIVADIWPGISSLGLGPTDLVAINGTLFFVASNGNFANGRELWKSNGTAAGTVMVKDIMPGSADSYPGSFTSVNGTLFFRANDGTNGFELWKSDGTTAGTVMVKDIMSGSAGSNPGGLTNVNGTLLFSANDGVHGQELWQSDGSTPGTSMVADIRPGGGDSNPAGLTNVNGTLYFSADDGVHGIEPWVLAPSSTPTVNGVQVNDGSAQRSRVTSLTVTFSTQISFSSTPNAAFTLTRNSDGVPVMFTATANVIGGITVVTLTNFTGSATQYGSLTDGRYTLTALASQISAGGQQMTSNYTFGDAQGLFRLYGDINGDRHVDIADFGLFATSYGSHFGQPGYLAYFDFNGDGVIDIADFGQFAIRMFTVLP